MTFESRHDAESLGPLLTQPGDAAEQDGALVGLLDLTRNLARLENLPDGVAAERVVALLGACNELALYLTRPNMYATQVTQRHLIARGRPCLVGVAGALAALRATWCKGRFSPPVNKPNQQLFFDRLRRLAVLATDAQQLFPELDWGIGQPSLDAAPSVQHAMPALLRERKPGDVWSAEQDAALLAYFDQRKRADGGLKSEALLDELGTSFSCSASNIKQRLAAARKARRGASVRKAA